MYDYLDFDCRPFNERPISEEYEIGSEMQIQQAYAEASALVDQCTRMGLIPNNNIIRLRAMIVDSDCRYVITRCYYDESNDETVDAMLNLESMFPTNWDDIAKQNLGIPR